MVEMAYIQKMVSKIVRQNISEVKNKLSFSIFVVNYTYVSSIERMNEW